MDQVRVGIKTKGEPRLIKEGKTTIVENMLIGDGFHWEKEIRAVLPGEIREISSKAYSEKAHNRSITLICTLPIEKYLECVVGSEMNPDAPIEFLKAHAVISRSWVLGKILSIHPENSNGLVNQKDKLVGWDDTSAHTSFHVCSDDHCQRFQGLQTIDSIVLEALRSTCHEVLLSPNGKLIDARFSKCCGGQTEIFSTCWQPLEMECLESIRDPWCDLSHLSGASRRSLLSSVLKDYDMATPGYGYNWVSEISKYDIGNNLQKHFGKNIGKIKKLTPIHRGPSGRIDLLKVEGSEGSLEIGKELWIRRILASSHLYSSAFQLEDLGDKLRIIGKGWGHGVGLCQIGAANMAYNGKTYQEILSFYYPGSILSSISEFKGSEL